MISILVLTLNEEDNLPGCLDTVRWSDDIHVLDSYSSDRTTDIARSYGAQVWSRKFDSFSQHQNWALQNIPFKYPWVFYFDADERVTPKLADAMQRAVENPLDHVAFRMQRRDFFLETWLKHVQMTAFYERLFRPEKMHYERLGHCISKPDGPVAPIEGYLDHYPFSKGIADWVTRHNFYSTQEAEQIVANRATGSGVNLRAIWGKDRQERRRSLKELYYLMPGRPLIKFLMMYFVKRGFLDGRAGFIYCVLIWYYEFLIGLKTSEIEQRLRNSLGTPTG
jgi:glycosyltransferase involved in cell wall biosynthesis